MFSILFEHKANTKLHILMVGVEYGGMLPLQCLLVWTVYLKLQNWISFFVLQIKVGSRLVLFVSKYRIFLFYQQIGKAPAKGIVSWKLSRCRWICLCLDVIRQMSYMLKRFENRQNSPGGCFPKICTIYHYCKMYRKSFKRCQIIFFHKKLNARM